MLESAAAKTLAIIGTIAIVLLTVMSGINDGAISALSVALIFSLTLLITVFDVDCVIIGSCNIWGWVKTVLTLLMLILILVIAILAVYRKENKKDSDANKEKK